ncbi:MAG: NAD-dependent protein deacylase [Clostridia bacterium]|nr:NAD-dependent protein deacylase [Clostridia bacterium]
MKDTTQASIDRLGEMIKESRRIVFFGGAGVSTESGIPDFRSADGLYNQKYDYPPEEILSHTFFMNKTEEFFKFYRDKLDSRKFEPNITHKRLAELEQEGKLTAVVTQNIDGLHQKAGSKNVYELHGSVLRNYCMRCKGFHGPEDIFDVEGVPRCSCGGLIKPDVVLYEEPLDDKVVRKAVNAIANADMLIVGGTSLTVYPAGSYITYYRGNKLVLVNKSKTQYDSIANLVINEGLGLVFSQV